MIKETAIYGCGCGGGSKPKPISRPTSLPKPKK